MQLPPLPPPSSVPCLLVPLLITLTDPFPQQRVVQDKHEASLGQKGRLKKANKALQQMKTRMETQTGKQKMELSASKFCLSMHPTMYSKYVHIWYI